MAKDTTTQTAAPAADSLAPQPAAVKLEPKTPAKQMSPAQTSPVAAVTRNPPESTDDVKNAQLIAIRQARAQMPGAKPYDPEAPEQEVAVMVNNGDHGGYRTIGRYFPNGLTLGVNVTEAELTELNAQPKELIHIVTGEEVQRLSGKSSSASAALSPDEQKVLSAFRSSGLGADAFLGQAQKTGTGK